MREADPLALRQELHKIALDFVGSFFVCQAHATGEPLHVRVDYHSGGNSKHDSENDVRRFPSDSGQLDQLGETLGNLPAEAFEKHASRTLNGSRFVAKKPSRSDILLQLENRGVTEIFATTVLTEEGGGHYVDALVRTLCREDGRDQELKCGLVMKRAMSVGIAPFQYSIDLTRNAFSIVQVFH